MPSMEEAGTSQTLLVRLRDRSDAEAWAVLTQLYAPWVQRWVRRLFPGAQPSDVDDLTQDVFRILVQELPQFRHNAQPGAFRTWLRTIIVHRLRVFWRSRRHPTQPQGRGWGDDNESMRNDPLAALEDPASALSQRWDREHDRHLLQSAFQVIRPEFQHSTWEAFYQTTVVGRTGLEVAQQLGLTPGAVYVAKSRVMKRLREVAQGLLDFD